RRSSPRRRAALDDLKDASVKAAESLKVSCPAYQMLTPTGRVEAMEKRLDATLGAMKTVQPPLAKFYNSMSDEQKARFNTLRSASRRGGSLHLSALWRKFIGGATINGRDPPPGSPWQWRVGPAPSATRGVCRAANTAFRSRSATKEPHGPHPYFPQGGGE